MGTERPLQDSDESQLHGNQPIFEAQTWHLSEGELTPEDTRAIAQALYRLAFRFDSDARNSFVFEMQDSRSLTRNQTLRLSAELYVEYFANRINVNPALAKRWFHQVSIDNATKLLPRFESESPGRLDIIKPTQNVKKLGIQATFFDHSSSCGMESILDSPYLKGLTFQAPSLDHDVSDVTDDIYMDDILSNHNLK